MVNRILIIEDNPGDYALIEYMLRDKISAPELTNAVTYQQAKEVFTAGKALPDVVLLDLTLPDNSGETLIADMLEIVRDIPIIILTGYEDIEFSTNSISYGIMDYLLKEELSPTTLYKSMLYAVERKNVTRSLMESEKRYSDLFHLSPEPMIIYDSATLRFIQVNKAARDCYGYSEIEFLDLTLQSIRYGDSTDWRALNQLDTSKHRKKNGEVMEVEVYSSDMILSGRPCKCLVVIDVTEKNRFEVTLTKAIIKTQEDERYEIGSELHDNVCQILATGNLSLGMLREQLSPDKISLLMQCKQQIMLATSEIRKLSHRLAPAFYESRTLEEEFALLLQTFNIRDDYQAVLHFATDVVKANLSKEIKLSLYRILQEQLGNIQKYAKGKKVRVDVGIREGDVFMEILDDGVGFNIDSAKHGIGLANMKRRVALFSGKFEVESSPGSGCRIKVLIPLSEAV